MRRAPFRCGPLTGTGVSLCPHTGCSPCPRPCPSVSTTAPGAPPASQPIRTKPRSHRPATCAARSGPTARPGSRRTAPHPTGPTAADGRLYRCWPSPGRMYGEDTCAAAGATDRRGFSVGPWACAVSPGRRGVVRPRGAHRDGDARPERRGWPPCACRRNRNRTKGVACPGQASSPAGCRTASAMSRTRSRVMPVRCSTARGWSVGSSSMEGRRPTGPVWTWVFRLMVVGE